MTKGVSKEQLDRINELAHKKKTVGLTAAELAEEEKNAISHRGNALRAMAAYLNGGDSSLRSE